MGYFGYAFVDLSKEQVHARRILLDQYALIAQCSIIGILLLMQLARLGFWWSKRSSQNYDETPSSPYLKAGALEGYPFAVKSWRHRLLKAKWWMEDEVLRDWGTRSQWIYGSMWFFYLLFLCINQTGNDYMHLTKRFGIVAASQLPLHYLLVMKSGYSPLQLVTRMSHEELNSSHQVLGKVIQGLLTLHAVFYLNFFIRINVLAKRIMDRDVILGLVCIAIITMIGSSAIATIRRRSYRLFYAIHVVLATLFLPLAYFHVHHIRVFILESAAIYVANVILRFVKTKTYQGSIELVPGTDLIKVSVSSTSSSQRLKAGQHVYLSMPDGYGDTRIPAMLLRNPFTVASIPHQDGSITLVARALKGNTKALWQVAHRADLHRADAASRLPMKIEGPYGAASHLADLRHFDRVLLVAGGVGATYIVPIWRNLVASTQESATPLESEARFVWAVRSLAETAWAMPLSSATGSEMEMSELGTVEVYVTSRLSTSKTDEDMTGEAMELAETDNFVSGDIDNVSEDKIVIKQGRPDLNSLVTDACSGHAKRIAILVCGPASMSRQLRAEVRRQVRNGKDVYFHSEHFGL